MSTVPMLPFLSLALAMLILVIVVVFSVLVMLALMSMFGVPALMVIKRTDLAGAATCQAVEVALQSIATTSQRKVILVTARSGVLVEAVGS